MTDHDKDPQIVITWDMSPLVADGNLANEITTHVNKVLEGKNPQVKVTLRPGN
jgi:hypothetical protein